MLRPWIGAGSLIGIAGLAALAVMVLAGDQPLAVATSAKTADITRPPFPNQGISLVVVLPFTGEGEERSPGQLVADRVTDDLINDLSSMPGIRVISRATSRLYKGRAVDVAAIGREIGVRYVVEGSVRVQGGTLRINVALTEAATRVQVWTERFERDQSDRFAVQDEIARSLARRLHVTVLTNEDRRRTPTDPAIDALLAKGWAAMLRISEVGKTGSADSYFEDVLKRDPDNVSALTGLGAYHAGVVARFQVADPEPHLARAEAALARAVKLNPRASLAHYFNGIVMKSRGRPQDALAAFERTLALNPSYAPAYAQTGHVLYRIGRLGEAIEYVRYAVRLSPRDPNLGLWSLFAGEIELELGHDEKALDWLNGALASDPKNPFMPAALAALYALRGDKAAAARYVEDTKKLAPWLTPERMIERLVGLSTKGFEPRRLLQGLRLAFGRPS